MGTIVVGIDGSESSLDALRWAVDEARRRHGTVEAVFAWTFPYAVPVPGHFSDPEWLEGEATEYLEQLLAKEPAGPTDVPVARRVHEGPAARALLDAAGGADMLVIGSRGRGGFSGLVLGSVSHQCAQHAACPVVVIRRGAAPESPERGEGTGRIVVGVDGSEPALGALRWALDEARLRRAAVDVVHAWLPPQMYGYPYAMVDLHLDQVEAGSRELLTRIIQEADTTGVPAVEPILVADGAARALLDTAEGAELLVVGSRGRGGFTGLLLGSVSQQALHHGPCPVVVVPAAG